MNTSISELVNLDEICYKIERIVNDLIIWGFFNSLEELINNCGFGNTNNNIKFVYDGSKVWMITSSNFNDTRNYLISMNSNIKFYIILLFKKRNNGIVNEYNKVKILIKNIINESWIYMKEKEIAKNCICNEYYYSGFLPDQNLITSEDGWNCMSGSESEEDLTEDERILPDAPLNLESDYQDVLKNILYQINGLSNILNISPEFRGNIIYSCKVMAYTQFHVAEYRIYKFIYDEGIWNMSFNNEIYRFIITSEDEIITVTMKTIDGNTLTFSVPQSNIINQRPWEIEDYWNIKFDCSDGVCNTSRF